MNNTIRKVLLSFSNILSDSIYSIFIVISLIFLFFSVFGGFGQTKISSVWGTGGDVFAFFVGSFILLFLIFLFYRFTENLTERSIKILTSFLMVLMLSVYILLFIKLRCYPTTDSFIVVDQADYFASHPEDILTTTSHYANYFGMYGNNYFIVILFSVLIRMASALAGDHLDIFRLLTAFNAVCLFLGNYLAFRIVCLYRGRRSGLRALFLLMLNPLGYLAMFWLYSCAISIPLLTGLLLLSLKCYSETDTVKLVLYSSLIGILSSLSYLIRPTSLIALIAAALAGFIYCLRNFRGFRRLMLTYLVCLLVIVLSYISLRVPINKRFSAELSSRNFPITHWLMIGSSTDGANSLEEMNYTGSFENKSEKVAHNLAAVKENYRNLGVTGTVSLYVNKVSSTFCDGYSSIGYRMHIDRYCGKIYDYLVGSKSVPFHIYCQCFRILSFFLLLIYALLSVNSDCADDCFGAMILKLTLIGGVLFYCLWEAKNIYSIPFIPSLLLCSEAGMNRLMKVSVPVGKKTVTKTHYIAFATLWLVVGLYNYPFFVGHSLSYTQYALRSSDNGMELSSLEEIVEENCGKTINHDETIDIRQDFVSRRSFNTINIIGRINNNGESEQYRITLAKADSPDSPLYSTVLTASDYSKSGHAFVLHPDMIQCDEPTSFTIHIKKIASGDSQLSFLGIDHIGPHMNCYEGRLSINGQILDQELAISAGYEGKAPYMRPVKYITLYFLVSIILFSFVVIGKLL